MTKRRCIVRSLQYEIRLATKNGYRLQFKIDIDIDLKLEASTLPGNFEGVERYKGI